MLPWWVATAVVGLGAVGALIWMRVRGQPAHDLPPEPARDGGARRDGGAGQSRRERGPPWTAWAALVVFATVAAVALLRTTAVAHDPVSALAADRAAVSGELTVASDPRQRTGRFSDYVVFTGEVREIAGRGSTYRGRTRVLVIGSPSWAEVRLGSRVGFAGRLAPAERGLGGLLTVRGEPEVVRGPDLWWRLAERVRASLRASVAHRPADQRALVPALVLGDDAGMDPRLVEDFRTTGLTHLTAVSGTNLTLLVGFLMIAGRWLGVRGRWAYLLAVVGIGGFLLLARAEPSVLRAATMGSVALIGLAANGRQRGVRALGAAVLALLLVDPGLATNPGFALSALATAGILLLAPGWREALARWLPRWLAEAIAVPSAAQLACTPIVAALSGQVSLVAVAANLLAGPLVGPATVLGLLGALLGLVLPAVGALCGTLASWCVAWIVVVARQGAGLPSAAVDWGVGPLALVLLTALCATLAVLLPRLLARPVTGLAGCLLLVVALLGRLPTPGWPPAGWIVAACDVGQGDALVVNAGGGAALVVDAGPDPSAVDRCLDRLEVDSVPVVVLTHFHADHIDGLAGVADGRPVTEIDVTSLADPPQGAREVAALASSTGAVERVPAYGEVRSLGPITWQVLWPPADPSRLATEGSAANNASVVLLVEVRGVRILLTGDIEPEAQRDLARLLGGEQVDVLKIPHHGSRHQDLSLLTGLRPRVTLTSVGADNDYGHPAAETLAPFEAMGVPVLRTDLDGDAVVVGGPERLEVVTSR